MHDYQFSYLIGHISTYTQTYNSITLLDSSSEYLPLRPQSRSHFICLELQNRSDCLCLYGNEMLDRS